MGAIWRVLLCLLLVSCGGGGGGGDDNSHTGTPLQGNYFPLATGDRWVYAKENGSLATVHVTGTSSVEGQPALVVAVSDPQDGSSTSAYRVTDTGVTETILSHDDPIVRQLGTFLVMRLPLRVGDSFVQMDKTVPIGMDLDGDGREDSAQVRATVDVIGVDDISTPAGAWAACAHLRTVTVVTAQLTAMGTVAVDTTTSDDWYAPDMGLVRSVITSTAGGLTETRTFNLAGYRVGQRRSDTTPPTVTATGPTSGYAQPATKVSVTFSEPMDVESVRHGFALIADDSRPVPGSIDWSDNTMRFTPMSVLAAGHYTATLAAEVQDRLGNPLGRPHSWSVTVDVTGPTVLSWSPSTDIDGPGLENQIVVQFSDLVDPGSIGPTTVQFSGGAVNLTVSGDTLTVDLLSPLAHLGTYTLVLNDGISDLAGNRMGLPFTLEFVANAGRYAFPAVLPGSVQAQSDTAMAVADVNNDGRADVLAIRYVGSASVPADQLLVFLQRSDGSLADPIPVALDARPSCAPTALATGDVSGDGRTDVTVLLGGCGVLPLYQSTSGGLVAGSNLPVSVIGPSRLLIVDLNGDGRKDLVGYSVVGNAVSFWLQDATGVLQPRPAMTLSDGYRPDFAVGDINGDGRPDLVFSGSSSLSAAATLVLQQADGSFAAPIDLPRGNLGLPGTGIAIGDINGDGRNDLVVTHGGNSPAWISVYLHQSNGQFGPATYISSSDLPEGVLVTDIDMDGRLDIVVGHAGSRTLGVYLQHSDGSMGSELLYRAPWNSGGLYAMVAADVNGDGRPDIVSMNQVMLQRPVPMQAEGGGRSGRLLDRVVRSAATARPK